MVEIHTTLVNAFPFVLRAKMRGFFRRSVYRYALATAMLAYALHFPNIKSIATVEFAAIWAAYFGGICGVVLVLILISAAIQSRHLDLRSVTFKEDAIIVSQGGATETKSWDWIIRAEDLADCFALLVQRRPRLEAFISKKHLSDEETRMLKEWLVEHTKLPSKRGAA
jgi:hypothetical protein